jgi:hypothetical protein
MTARRAILQVLTGRDAFRKIVLDPGQAIRIGDGDWAHEVITMPLPEGARGVDVLWDGLGCRVDGIGAAPWFYLGGRAVLGGYLQNHEFLQIGGTQLRLTLEGFSHRAPSLGPAAQKAREALRAFPRVHAVLDAARDPRVLECIEDAVDPHRSLFEGIEGRALDDVAPYLVQLDPNSPLLDVLLSEGWGNAWGIFLAGSAELEDVRRHLRRFLMVDDEALGRRLYFRFYDPRAHRDFLPVAAAWQRDSLLAIFDLLVLEADDGEALFVQPGNEVPYWPPPGLTISAWQMGELDAVHRQRAVAFLMRLLRTDHADWVAAMDDAALAAWIDGALERADRCGIDTGPEAIQFVLLWRVLGPDPEALPWVADILAAPEYLPIGRIRALIDEARLQGVPDLERAILPEMEVPR